MPTSGAGQGALAAGGAESCAKRASQWRGDPRKSPQLQLRHRRHSAPGSPLTGGLVFPGIREIFCFVPAAWRGVPTLQDTLCAVL